MKTDYKITLHFSKKDKELTFRNLEEGQIEDRIRWYFGKYLPSARTAKFSYVPKNGFDKKTKTIELREKGNRRDRGPSLEDLQAEIDENQPSSERMAEIFDYARSRGWRL